MRPHLPLSRASSPIFCAILALGTLMGCNDKKEEKDVPLAPWRKDSADPAKAREQKTATFTVSEGQLLQFELPAKRAKAAGAIGGVSGEVFVNLDALQFVSGALHFDFAQLRMTPGEWKSQRKRLKAAKEETSNTEMPEGGWTQTARMWLGLGTEVPGREKNARATFTIESAKALSHASAWAGARRKTDKESEGEIREVKVTAVGKLSMRSLSVQRTVPLSLRFHYPQAATRGAVPERITVSLRGDVRIPLSEYEIRPRDNKGHEITQDEALIGQVVGSTVRVSGNIELTADL